MFFDGDVRCVSHNYLGASSFFKKSLTKSCASGLEHEALVEIRASRCHPFEFS